jgi:hypothetical protein
MSETKSNPREPHPGMMGDGTEEQNLNQEGNPAARITEDEVKEAFDDGAGPNSRAAETLPDDEVHDQLADRKTPAENRQEALIDESLEESFPASDPPSAKHIT